MIDVRISVRLTNEVHEQLKILTIKRKTNINQFLVDYIHSEIEADKAVERNRPNSGARILSLFANIGVAEAYFEDNRTG